MKITLSKIHIIIYFLALSLGLGQLEALAMRSSGGWRWLWIIILIAWALYIARQLIGLWNQYTGVKKKRKW